MSVSFSVTLLHCSRDASPGSVLQPQCSLHMPHCAVGVFLLGKAAELCWGPPQYQPGYLLWKTWEEESLWEVLLQQLNFKTKIQKFLHKQRWSSCRTSIELLGNLVSIRNVTKVQWTYCKEMCTDGALISADWLKLITTCWKTICVYLISGSYLQTLANQSESDCSLSWTTVIWKQAAPYRGACAVPLQ